MTEEKETKTDETKEANAGETSGEPKEEENKEDAKDESDKGEQKDDDTPVEVPEQFKKLVEEIENLSVLELNELVKVLEKKFGVSATAVAAAPAAGAEGGAEEKDEFTVELASVGDQKIAVIKVVKEAAGLGLKEAKDLVESAPTAVKENVKKEDAEELKSKLEEAGATVALK